MMARKAKLPFLVQPKRQPILERFGDEEIGSIEIERKGYLTVAEKSFMQQSTSGDTALVALQRLASKVARETNRKPAEVMQSITEGDFGDPAFDPYEQELEILLAQLGSLEARNISSSCS